MDKLGTGQEPNPADEPIVARLNDPIAGNLLYKWSVINHASYSTTFLQICDEYLELPLETIPGEPSGFGDDDVDIYRGLGRSAPNIEDPHWPRLPDEDEMEPFESDLLKAEEEAAWLEIMTGQKPVGNYRLPARSSDEPGEYFPSLTGGDAPSFQFPIELSRRIHTQAAQEKLEPIELIHKAIRVYDVRRNNLEDK